MTKKKTKQQSENVSNNIPEITGMSIEKQVNFFEDCISEIFEERKAFFVGAVMDRFKDVIAESKSNSDLKVNEAEWVKIDSLSKLRAIVGGRFENLKAKWLGAGFPLKESKGAELGNFTLSEEGWIELTSWISNQGFETKLSHEEDCLFMLRDK